VSNATGLADDEALGLAVGLNVLPKATHDRTYSWRVRREMNTAALTELVRRLCPIGLASGDAGFNLDFHAIRHYGEDAPLDDNYVAKRSQATRSVLAFFAQDHASTEMVYTNADVTKRAAATEVLAFADHWKATSGLDPGLLVFDSRLTTYAVLEKLSARGIDWLTLRQPGAIAVRNIGRDQPTLLITNDATATAKDLFARYAERMLIENELSAYIKGFQVDALSSGLALNVDLDTTLITGNVYRLLARSLKRYEHATPETIYEQFIDTTGSIDVEDDAVTVTLTRRTYTPVLLQAGFAELDLPIPWWGGRHLRFRFK
jgi:hypothetical protein